MARKGQLSIQESLSTNEELQEYLEKFHDILICLEVYSEYCGYCQATMNAVKRAKLEIGGEKIAMAKASADTIDVLSRFRGKSEPTFLFITKGKLNRAMFGANGIKLCQLVEEELAFMEAGVEGEPEPPEDEEKPLGGRPSNAEELRLAAAAAEPPKRLAYSIGHMLPEEKERMEESLRLYKEHHEATERLRSLTLAARKKRVNERLTVPLWRYNFIMFFPHCHQAHYDLYEQWDIINVTVSAKETIELDDRMISEALYMSDVEQNDACLHALRIGPVMVVLLKMFDTDDRDFVKLLRRVLYEDIPIPKEDVMPDKQLPPFPAYERYATISKSAREVRRERYNVKMEKLRQEREERERLEAEQARLARQEEEEKERLQKEKEEQEKFARIQAGLSAEPEPGEDEVAAEGDPEVADGEATAVEGDLDGQVKPDEIPDALEPLIEEGNPEEGAEEKVEEEEAFHSDVSVEGEDYIPPRGLFVPGFYTPPNHLAKCNGLVLFFPKLVASLTAVESEHLPPHVLVMFVVDKRHDVMEVIDTYRDEILQMGIFAGDDPPNMSHVAYTIRQYDKMDRPVRYKDRLALMVSRKRSLPLLQLAGHNPCYISSDATAGEKDCLTLFPVGYADDYEEPESVVEEEVVVQDTVPEQEPEQVATEQKEKDDDDDDD